MDKIYLIRGNDTPLSVCLRKSEGEGDPVPYDLSTAERMRLALVGHGMHVFAEDIEISGEDNNIISGVIPGRSLLKGDYDLEVTFNLDGRDKRFAVKDMFEAVDFLAEDADGEAEGEGAGIFVTVTVQPELIEISGPTGPQGKSAYQVWLDDGHTGTEDDFFEWLAAQTPNPDWEQNDPSKADYIKNRTHWEEESSTTINDAKLAWSGSTSQNLDFWFHGTNEHIPRTSTGWGLTWEGGELFIDDMGSGYEIGVFNGEEWEYNPFDPSFDQQPYPLGVDVVIASETVHKLDNKYIDMDLVPTAQSDKPVMSGGVASAISNFITSSVNDLVNYYLKSETYTKAEVNQLVAGINNWEIVPVAQLPEASADTMHKIYLVPSSNPKTRNVKDEFITVEVSGAYSWEQIGTTAIDLTNYVTKQELTEALADYVTSAAFTQAMATKQDKIDAQHKLDYSLLDNTPEIPDPSDFATKEEVSQLRSEVGNHNYSGVLNVSTTVTKVLDVDIKSGQYFHLYVSGNFGSSRVIVGANGAITPRLLDTSYGSATDSFGNKVGVRYKLLATADLSSINLWASPAVNNVSVEVDVDANVSEEIRDNTDAADLFVDTHGEYHYSESITYVANSIKRIPLTPEIRKIKAGEIIYFRLSGIPANSRVILSKANNINADNKIIDRTFVADMANFNTPGQYFAVKATSDIENVYFYCQTAFTGQLSVDVLVDRSIVKPFGGESALNRVVFNGYPTLKSSAIEFSNGYMTANGTSVGDRFNIPPVKVPGSYDYAKYSLIEVATKGKVVSLIDMAKLSCNGVFATVFLDKNMIVRYLYPRSGTNLIFIVPNDVAYILVQSYAATQSALDEVSGNIMYYEIADNNFAEVQQNPLYGKNIITIGDSITATVDSINMSWPNWLREIFKCNVYNFGVGATHIETRETLPTDPSDPSYDAAVARSWLSVYQIAHEFNSGDVTNLKNAATKLELDHYDVYCDNLQYVLDHITDMDAVVIFSGTNGSDYISDKGSTDWDDYDKTKPNSALNAAIKMWCETNPNIAIFIVTPVPRYYGDDWNDWDDDYYSDNYTPAGFSSPAMLETVNGIETVAHNNSVACCDLYRTLGINRYNFSSWFRGVDGTHPVKGLKRIARKIGQFIISQYNLIR